MRANAFYLFASLAAVFALFAVTRKSPVHSALMLVLSLLSLAGVYLALGAVFVALAQVFVYAGAIVVLFLFVIMLVGTKPEYVGARARSGFLAGLGVAALLFIALFTKRPHLGSMIEPFEVAARELAVPLIGWREWSEVEEVWTNHLGVHALAFELGSVLVLVAIVGSVMLTRRAEHEEKKRLEGGGSA